MEDDFLKKPHPYSICEKCQKIARDEYRLYIGDVLETKLNLLESIRYTKDYKARHSLASKIIKFLFNISRRMDNNYWLIYRRFDSEKYKCAECKTWYRCKFMKSIVVSQIFNFIIVIILLYCTSFRSAGREKPTDDNRFLRVVHLVDN